MFSEVLLAILETFASTNVGSSGEHLRTRNSGKNNEMGTAPDISAWRLSKPDIVAWTFAARHPDRGAASLCMADLSLVHNGRCSLWRHRLLQRHLRFFCRLECDWLFLQRDDA